LTANFSKTQIDRLGDRLRKGETSEADLRLLDEYRRSFGPTYESVIGTIRGRLQLDPTGRPAKSTSSIIDKLHRESIRLSQIQDIAGCRIVVADSLEQDRVVPSLSDVFPGATIVDRRVSPSFGYRAVHVIANMSGRLIEIQVRSSFQHFWADLSEKLSDVFDPTIKYGGGSQKTRELLTRLSSTGLNLEEAEKSIAFMQKKIEDEPQLKKLQDTMVELKQALAEAQARIIHLLEDNIDDLFN
jgi:putative GTP pyrophosphokinase